MIEAPTKSQICIQIIDTDVSTTLGPLLRPEVRPRHMHYITFGALGSGRASTEPTFMPGSSSHVNLLNFVGWGLNFWYIGLRADRNSIRLKTMQMVHSVLTRCLPSHKQECVGSYAYIQKFIYSYICF